MDFRNILNQMTILVAIMALGFLLGKAGLINAEANKYLSKLVTIVLQSALIISSIADVDVYFGVVELLSIIGTSFVMYALIGVIAFVVPKLIRAPRTDTGVYSFMTTFGNVVFIGFPVVSSMFGAEAVFFASIFNIPHTVLIFSLGVFFLSGEKNSFSPKELINAPLISTLAAIVIFLLRIPLPSQVCDTVSMLGSTTIPLGMLIIGSSLSRMKTKDIFCDWRAYIMALIKLVICPVSAWLLLRLFVQDEMILGIAVVLASMPVATITTMLCIRYERNELAASKSVLMSTLLSVLTIPLMAYWLL